MSNCFKKTEQGATDKLCSSVPIPHNNSI